MSDFSVVQLTDTHFQADAAARMANVEIDATFSAVLDELEQQSIRPDLVLLTGDLADDPDLASYPAVYARLAAIVRQHFGAITKICAVPGNHDNGASFHHSLNAAGIQTDGDIEHGNWRICLLDSTIPGSNGGSLTSTQIEMVRKIASTNPEQHIALVLHHPPISLNSRWMDTMTVKNASDLFAALANFNNIQVCIWGHAHQEWDSQFQGIRQLGAPAACPVQFQPLAAEYAIDTHRNPGCRHLLFYPNGHIDTRVIRTSK